MPVIPDYYQELRLDPAHVTDECVRKNYTQRVHDIRADLDLNVDQAKECEEKALRAFEMLQCASSRNHVDQALRTGKVSAAVPCPHPLPWSECIFSHSLSYSEKAKKEWQGTWTEKQQAQHAAFMERGGHLIKARHISSETQFMELVRYNCSFNAFSILGMRQVSLCPEVIEASRKNACLQEWRKTSLGELSASALKTYDDCVCFSTRCLLSSRAMDYIRALQLGYVERVEQGVTYRMPVTRTNILHAFLSEDECGTPPAKRSKHE